MPPPSETSQLIKPRTPRRWIRSVIAAGMSLAIVLIVWRSFASHGELARALAHARWGWSFIPAAIAIGNLPLAALRWRTLLRASGHNVPFGTCLRVVLAAWPAGAITRAGDLMRAYYAHPVIPVPVALSATFTEKLIDIQSMCLIAAVAALVNGRPKWSAFALALMVGLWLVPATAPYWSKLGLPLAKSRLAAQASATMRMLAALLAAPGRVTPAVAVSLIACVNAVLLEISLLRIFDAKLAVLDVFWAWPLAALVGVLPISLAGVGTRDLTFFWLLRSAGSVSGDPTAILLATISYPLFTMLLTSMIALPLTWSYRAPNVQ